MLSVYGPAGDAGTRGWGGAAGCRQALEPIFSVAFGFIIDGKIDGFAVNFWLIPIVGGVIWAAVGSKVAAGTDVLADINKVRPRFGSGWSVSGRSFVRSLVADRDVGDVGVCARGGRAHPPPTSHEQRAQGAGCRRRRPAGFLGAALRCAPFLPPAHPPAAAAAVGLDARVSQNRSQSPCPLICPLMGGSIRRVVPPRARALVSVRRENSASLRVGRRLPTTLNVACIVDIARVPRARWWGAGGRRDDVMVS